MTDQLVSFETAKLAKEKGFVFHLWPNWEEIDAFIKGGRAHHVLPTQSLLQKWLREVHDIHVYATHKQFIVDDSDGYYWHQGKSTTNVYHGPHKTYEGALENGLQEGLKLIKS